MTWMTRRRLALVGGLSLAYSWWGIHEAAAGLYQCRTDEGLIYTDMPAQLTQCTPFGQGGESSRLGVVGGPSTGSASPAPTPSPAQPQPVAPSTAEGTSTSVSSPPDNTAGSSPCVSAINPLNPLSAPPCSSSEAAPPTTVPPPDASISPAAPAQP